MRAFILFLFVLCMVFAKKRETEYRFHTTVVGSPYRHDQKSCHDHRDVTLEFIDSIFHFGTTSFKAIARRSNYHFVFSPIALWIIIATLAEGADRTNQQELFRFLNLPDDVCLRQKYYKIATSRIWPGDDANIVDTRALVIDESLKVNLNWYNFVKDNKLIDVISAPIKRNPEQSIKEMRRILGGSRQSFDLIGNSVLLDGADYDGLWATAFNNAVLERAPFYDIEGRRLGSVDLMRMKRKVRMAYMPRQGIKVLELPIGIGDRYRMLFAMIVTDKDVKSTVELFSRTVLFDFLGAIQWSKIAIDVAIPRFSLTSDINARAIFEDIGISNLWSEEAATSFISDPPALPSTFIQRTTINLNPNGLLPPEVAQVYSGNATTGLDLEIGRDFIANRPFLFALLDAETYSILMCSGYSQPTYTD